MDLQMPADFPHLTYTAVERGIVGHLNAFKSGVDAPNVRVLRLRGRLERTGDPVPLCGRVRRVKRLLSNRLSDQR